MTIAIIVMSCPARPAKSQEPRLRPRPAPMCFTLLTEHDSTAYYLHVTGRIRPKWTRPGSTCSHIFEICHHSLVERVEFGGGGGNCTLVQRHNGKSFYEHIP